mmetsp:Transcript_26238/g.36954  ORF Transcript_26238/g.36954 Transcript_26238/m.36954 type:complete len:495 (-) Transcript_26238:48-1532(-)
MAEAVCKLCRPREHSFAKDGRKSRWSVVQNSGLRPKVEDDFFRVEHYTGNMPRWKFRLMLHRNDFYLRIAVSSDLDKLLQKYWHYVHVVLPTMIPASIQDEKDRLSWIIQHLTFLYKQEKKQRLKKLHSTNEEDLDLHHLEDLEELSEWSSDEEEESLISTADEVGIARSDSELTVIQHSPPKHSNPQIIMTPADKVKYRLVPDTKSFSDPHVVGSLQNSPKPTPSNENNTQNEHSTDLNNYNNMEGSEEFGTKLTRSNSLPNQTVEASEDGAVVVMKEEEKKKSKWKQFFKRKPGEVESPDEYEEHKDKLEVKKMERDDASRLSVYASIDRPAPKSPSLFKKLKKKSEQDISVENKESPPQEDSAMTWIRGVMEELFDEDAPRDVRTSKYCILGVCFAIIYAFLLRYSSFDLFMILLVVLCLGIIYLVKERRTIISMAAKRKLRKVVRQEKRKFLGWLPNSASTQKEAATKEKEREKEKDLGKEEDKVPSGTS